MDHDALFKLLITGVFRDFIRLFAPALAEHIDPDTEVVVLPNEMIAGPNNRKRRIVDLIVRVKVRGQDSFFLIHVENQAARVSDFSERMFHYYCYLTLQYGLPIYPIAVFSYDTPRNPEPSGYQEAFPDLKVLTFNYRVIQLNRIPWRRYITSDNPAACALMAKMKIAPKDRPRVKLECLRMLAKLQLDPDKAKLIGVFIESYLQLSAAEMAKYEREFSKLTEEEQEATMELMTSWEKKGLEQGLNQGLNAGLHDGKAQMLLRLLQSRFGSIPQALNARVSGLSSSALDDLGDALLDLATLDDVERWLATHH